MSYPADDATPEPQDPHVRTDTYRNDKNSVTVWVARAIAASFILWAPWVTVELFALRESAALARAAILAVDTQAQTRDLALESLAHERQAQIQLQLAQIQTQCAEIQRALRYGIKP